MDILTSAEQIYFKLQKKYDLFCFIRQNMFRLNYNHLQLQYIIKVVVRNKYTLILIYFYDLLWVSRLPLCLVQVSVFCWLLFSGYEVWKLQTQASFGMWGLFVSCKERACYVNSHKTKHWPKQLDGKVPIKSTVSNCDAWKPPYRYKVSSVFLISDHIAISITMPGILPSL